MLVHRFWALSLALAILMFAVARAEEAPAGGAVKPKLKLNRAAAAAIAAAARQADDNAPAKEGDAGDAEKKDGEPDRFAVPEGGVKELLAFLQELAAFRPRTRDELLEFRAKGQAAMQEAAEKIKKLATDEDKKLPGYSDVEGILLYSKAQNRELSNEDRQQLIDELKAYFADNAELSKYGVMAAQILASSIEHSANPQEAIGLYRQVGPVLAKSDNPQYARVGRKMEGSIRRLELPGNFMEISGKTPDGSELEWSKYRGKVVLVDFWATWCGPCIAELPNVRKNYELYHDKGFDVVGISLDSDDKRLEEFLKTEELPWTTIYEGGGWDTPMAAHYGINSIPRAILVDKDGKVVSMNARGNELGKLLAEMLGPAEPEAAEKTPDAEKPDADK